jgi:hypothetical protein
MSIQAPLSKYKKHNMLITMVILLGIAATLGYDGYLSQYEWSKRYDFYKEHVINNNGVPDGDMTLNRYGAIVLLAFGLYNGFNYWKAKDKKIIADERGLVYEGLTIAYQQIDSIDKTFFSSKGYFVIHYKDDQQQTKTLKLSDRQYDNMPAVLDHLVSKLTS